jgi:5-methylcytosine-specific restriction endonuclease McrA
MSRSRWALDRGPAFSVDEYATRSREHAASGDWVQYAISGNELTFLGVINNTISLLARLNGEAIDRVDPIDGRVIIYLSNGNSNISRFKKHYESERCISGIFANQHLQTLGINRVLSNAFHEDVVFERIHSTLDLRNNVDVALAVTALKLYYIARVNGHFAVKHGNVHLNRDVFETHLMKRKAIGNLYDCLDVWKHVPETCAKRVSVDAIPVKLQEIRSLRYDYRLRDRIRDWINWHRPSLASSDDNNESSLNHVQKRLNREQYPADWDNERQVIYKRDNYRCVNCGSVNVELHAHHIVPLSLGGTNAMTNLVTLCRDCHEILHPHMRD